MDWDDIPEHWLEPEPRFYKLRAIFHDLTYSIAKSRRIKSQVGLVNAVRYVPVFYKQERMER